MDSDIASWCGDFPETSEQAANVSAPQRNVRCMSETFHHTSENLPNSASNLYVYIVTRDVFMR